MVKLIESKRKRFARFWKEVFVFGRQKWKELWHPKPDIEINKEVSKMTEFITNNFSPKDQAKAAKGMKAGILASLNTEAIAAEKRAKECREAIILINKV